MVQIFNSIFPKVSKNGFRTFVPRTFDMLAVLDVTVQCWLPFMQVSCHNVMVYSFIVQPRHSCLIGEIPVGSC